MNKKYIKLLLLLAVLILINLIHPSSVDNSKNQDVKGTSFYISADYQVINVEDGDTITVNMNGKNERIRFIGVDTPETKDPRKPIQCFGKQASEFTKQKINKSKVRLESDELNTNRDRYNRLLRYIYLPNGELLNATIIEQGYGFAYTNFPFTKKHEFKQLQTVAQAQKRGLWNACKPSTNKYGDYSSNPE